MRIVEVNYSKPVNLLIAALQRHCMHLLANPEQYGVYSLANLEDKIFDFAKKNQAAYPRCKVTDLEVISNSSIISEWYTLLYKGEKSMISILVRPDAYEECFRELDKARTKHQRGYLAI